MKIMTAVRVGLLGGLATTALGGLARASGMPVNLELLLGTRVGIPLGWLALAVGFAMHMAASAGIALVYAFGFERLTRRADWGLGIGFSLIHTAIAGAFLGVLPALHPRVPDLMPAPGAYLANLGALGAGTFILLHMVYGAIVGGLYGEPRSGPQAITQPEGSSKVGRVAAAPEADAGADLESDLIGAAGRRPPHWREGDTP